MTVNEIYMTSMEKFDTVNLIPSLNVDRKSRSFRFISGWILHKIYRPISIRAPVFVSISTLSILLRTCQVQLIHSPRDPTALHSTSPPPSLPLAPPPPLSIKHVVFTSATNLCHRSSFPHHQAALGTHYRTKGASGLSPV